MYTPLSLMSPPHHCCALYCCHSLLSTIIAVMHCCFYCLHCCQSLHALSLLSPSPPSLLSQSTWRSMVAVACSSDSDIVYPGQCVECGLVSCAVSKEIAAYPTKPIQGTINHIYISQLKVCQLAHCSLQFEFYSHEFIDLAFCILLLKCVSSCVVAIW